MRRLRLLAAPLALVLLALSACGSEEEAAGADAGPALLDEAKEISEASKQRPTAIPATEPIGKDVPSGKTIASILCGLTSCEELNQIFTEAAEVLGWKVVPISTTGAPESVKDAWAQAVRMEPDAVIASGHDAHIYANELAALKKKGIPVVQNSIQDDATEENGMLAVFNNPSTTRAGGLSAAYVVDHAEGEADVLYVDIPAYAILQPVREQFEAETKRLCPACSVQTLDVALTQVGKELPNMVVSKLRANPDINYVYFPSGATSAGVSAALKAAGLSEKVNIVTASSGATNFAAVAGGDELAAQVLGFYELMWLEADTLARHFAGVEVGDLSELELVRQTLVQDNVVETGGLYPLVEDYDDQYKQLWGIS